MVLFFGVLALYLLLLAAVVRLSVRPYRIPQWISPGVLGAPQEEVTLTTEDGVRLRGWWVPSEGATSVMVMAHGYMMNRSELTPEAYLLWQKGVSCLLIDERCHGRSGGRRSTIGYAERLDVRAAVAEARRRMPDAKIGLIGSSMGAAACAFALAEDPSLADLIVLDSAYGRLTSASLGWWRFLGGKALSIAFAPTVLLAWPLTGVNPFHIDVASAVVRFQNKPTLYFHGACDILALPSEAERNFAATPEPKRIVWFNDCSHSEGRWEQAVKYRAELVAFLEEHGFFAEIPA